MDSNTKLFRQFLAALMQVVIALTAVALGAYIWFLTPEFVPCMGSRRLEQIEFTEEHHLIEVNRNDALCDLPRESCEVLAIEVYDCRPYGDRCFKVYHLLLALRPPR